MKSSHLPILTIFGWPSHLGGADTKLADLLDLLKDEAKIIVVPNWDEQLRQDYWTQYMLQRGITPMAFNDWAISKYKKGKILGLCNEFLFTRNNGNPSRWEIAKELGNYMIYSSEMPWHQTGELEHVNQGYIDLILYVSEVQKKHLTYPHYQNVCMTGNYVCPDRFPFYDRRVRWENGLVYGRISRAHEEKYSEDFPVVYELLADRNTKFRVMGWKPDLSEKYKWHTFDTRWELLPELKETPENFLNSIDIKIYCVGRKFTETWGRSIVEGMLTGVVPVVPKGHHIEENIVNGVTGYVFKNFNECQNAVNLLRNPEHLFRVSLNTSHHARDVITNKYKNLKLWRDTIINKQ